MRTRLVNMVLALALLACLSLIVMSRPDPSRPNWKMEFDFRSRACRSLSHCEVKITSPARGLYRSGFAWNHWRFYVLVISVTVLPVRQFNDHSGRVERSGVSKFAPAIRAAPLGPLGANHLGEGLETFVGTFDFEADVIE